MEVNIESTGAVTRRLRVTIPSENVESEFEARLRHVASRARLSGFRPGKAPLKVIRQQYGQSARIETIEQLVSKTYPEALAKAQIQPAGPPEIQVEAERPGEPLVYTASIDVFPQVEVDPEMRLRVEAPTVEVTDADIDRLVDNLRRQRREWVKVEREAGLGDRVVIDFNGTIDGQPFGGNHAEKLELEIGQARFLPALEESIRGHLAGDHYEVNVTFPEDYHREDVRGKTALFKVAVHEVQEPKLPAIDEEFLKRHGVEADKGEAGLREKCRTALEAERDKAVRGRQRTQLFDQLLERYPLEMPPSRVRQEIERMREETAGRMNVGRNLKPEQLRGMMPDEMFTQQATRRVALGLLLAEVIKRKDIKPDPARLEKQLELAVAEYEKPDEARQHFRANAQLMNQLASAALEEQITESLLAQAEVVPTDMTLQALLNPKPATQA